MFILSCGVKIFVIMIRENRNIKGSSIGRGGGGGGGGGGKSTDKGIDSRSNNTDVTLIGEKSSFFVFWTKNRHKATRY